MEYKLEKDFTGHKLHYAELRFDNLGIDIPVFKFDNFCQFEEILREINNHDDTKKVYVFSYGDGFKKDTEVLITTKIDMIIDFISLVNGDEYKLIKHENFFLFEFYSYEEAYENALDIKEGTSEICYKSTNP